MVCKAYALFSIVLCVWLVLQVRETIENEAHMNEEYDRLMRELNEKNVEEEAKVNKIRFLLSISSVYAFHSVGWRGGWARRTFAGFIKCRRADGEMDATKCHGEIKGGKTTGGKFHSISVYI